MPAWSLQIAFVGYKLVPMLYTDGDNEMLMQGGINTRINSTQLWIYAVVRADTALLPHPTPYKLISAMRT